MKYGTDALGGVRFKKELLAAIGPGQVVGFFYTTFSKNSREGPELLEALCKAGCSDIPVHLAPFDNSHRYPIAQLMPKLRIWAAEVEAISKRYPNSVVMMSPFCEHNHTAKEMIPVFNELKRIAPSCLMLNSIWKGERVPGIITELHLSRSNNLPRKPRGEYTISFDGFGGVAPGYPKGTGDYPDCDIQAILKRYADARHIRCWNFRFNGKAGADDATPLANRVSWPSIPYIIQMLSAMKTREGELTFSNNELYKSVADDHPPKEASWKDCKALAIFQGQTNTAEVIDRNGNVIDRMVRVMGDHTGKPKGRRYYSKLYAYQIAAKARAKTGSSLVRFRSGKVVTPYTDADLRSGMFK